MQPFTGKLVYAFAIAGGLFIAVSILNYYGWEMGARLLFGMIGAGLIIIPLVLRHYNKRTAKREAEVVRPLKNFGDGDL